MYSKSCILTDLNVNLFLLSVLWITYIKLCGFLAWFTCKTHTRAYKWLLLAYTTRNDSNKQSIKGLDKTGSETF